LSRDGLEEPAGWFPLLPLTLLLPLGCTPLLLAGLLIGTPPPVGLLVDIVLVTVLETVGLLEGELLMGQMLTTVTGTF